MSDYTVFDDRFWENENSIMRDEISPIVLKILLSGAQSGVSMLPEGLEILIDWDTFNSAAVDWLLKYEAGWLHGINATTRSQVVKIIDEWIRTGDALPILRDRLTPIFGAERATMIAATEVTRIYAEGNLSAWRSTGVVTAKKWQTARDDRVCPICAPLHNKVVSIEGGWSRNDGGAIIEHPEGLLAPPAHIRCRCWLLPVVSQKSFERRIDEILSDKRYNAVDRRRIMELYNASQNRSTRT